MSLLDELGGHLFVDDGVVQLAPRCCVRQVEVIAQEPQLAIRISISSWLGGEPIATCPPRKHKYLREGVGCKCTRSHVSRLYCTRQPPFIHVTQSDPPRCVHVGLMRCGYAQHGGF